jgi:hypothetical protein
MKASIRRLVLLSILFVISAAVFLPLGQWLTPLYAQLLADLVRRILSSATVTLNSPQISITLNEVTGTFHVDAMMSFLAILMILLVITPRLSWQRRLLLILVGLILQVASQSLQIALDFLSAYSLLTQGKTEWHRWAQYIWATVEKISPLFLWALLTWRSWLPVPQPTRRPTKEARP